MLQSLRDNLKGTFAFIIIAIIIVPLALFGVDSLFDDTGAGNDAAQVNGEGISEISLRRAIYMQKQQMMARFGQNLPADFVSDERLREPVLNNLIERSLLTQDASIQGMAISSAKLDQIILSAPQFQADGKFNADQFVDVLNNTGYTPATYKVLLEQDMMGNQLQLGLTSSNFTLSNELAATAALMRQTRDFNFFVLPLSAIEVTVTAEEVDAYYNSNKTQFVQAEQVAIEYIELTPDALISQVDISEADIEAQYQINVERFSANTERRAAHILLELKDDGSEQAVLASVQQKLAAGEDFSELAKTYSEDVGSSATGGDLGFSAGDTFPEAFESALVALELNQVSAAVETDAGIHLIKLLEIRGDKVPSLDEQRPNIRYALKHERAEAQFNELLESLAELSYNAENLTEVGEELNLTVKVTELFGRSGGSGISADAKVLEAVFSDDVLNQGNSSELLELGNNRALVLKLVKHVESHVKDLELVSADINALLKETQAKEKLNAMGADLVIAAEQGKSLESLAASKSLELKQHKDTLRTDTNVTSEVLQKTFTLPKYSASSSADSKINAVVGFALNNGDYAVLSLAKVNVGDVTALNDSERVGLSEQLAQASGLADFTAYRATLKGAAKVVVR